MHPLAKRRVAYVERNAVAGADAGRADGIDQKWSQKTPRHRAVSQRGNTQPVREQHSSHDDRGVIEKRPEGGKQKQPSRQQYRRNHATDVKEKLRRKQNAGQVNAKLHLFRIEFGEELA